MKTQNYKFRLKSMALVFVVLFTLLINDSLFAQWSQVSTTGINNGYATSRCITSGDNKLFSSLTQATTSLGEQGGVFVSEDNGTTWTPFNRGLPALLNITDILVDGTTIYVAVDKNGVYFSSTTSANFTKLIGGTIDNTNNYSKLAKIGNKIFLGTKGKGVFFTDLTTVNWAKIGGTNMNVNTLAIDNVSGFDRLYIGTQVSSNGLYVSDGPDFLNVTQKSPSPQNVNALLVSGTKIYLGTQDDGFYIGDNSTYTFVKHTTGILPKERINYIKIIGSTLYMGTQSHGIWNSSTTEPLNWTKSTNFNLRTINCLTTKGTDLYISSNYGTWKTSNNIDFTNVHNPAISPNRITSLEEKNGNVYATTMNGLYKQNGSNWDLVGFNNMEVHDIALGNNTMLANAEGMVYKYNSPNWVPVAQQFSGDYRDMDKGNYNDIEVFNDGTKDIFYTGGWRNVGLYKSVDEGNNWSVYTDVTSVDNTTGLWRESSTDSTQLTLARNYVMSPISKKLFALGKNRVQHSSDWGQTWYTRIGNGSGLGQYNINTSQSNGRGLLARVFKGKEYLLYSADEQNNCGEWSLGITEVNGNECSSGSWIKGGNYYNGGDVSTGCFKLYSLYEHGEKMLFSAYNRNTAIVVSEDNGLSFNTMNTGYTNVSLNNEIDKIGNYLYALPTKLELWRYELSTLPQLAATYPKIDVVAANQAKVVVKSNRPGKYYWVALDPAATQPSATAIVAGLDGNGNMATIKGNTTTISLNDIDVTVTVNALVANTSYKIYIVQKSELLNLSNVGVLSVTTLPVRLTIAKNTGGNVTPSEGITNYGAPQVQKIEAQALPDYVFQKWIVSSMGTITTKSVNVMVSGDISATAFFLKQITLTSTMSGTSLGANVSLLGTYTFVEGQDITVTATPAANTRVQKWIVDGMPYLISTNVFEITLGNINSTLEVVFESVSKIAENMIHNLSIYPNPTNGMLFVKNDGNLKSITLYDLAGKAISVKQVEGKQMIEINAKNFKNGVYMLRIIDSNGKVSNFKFVKQ